MRLLELDFDKGSEIQLKEKEIEFIYRATKCNLFAVDNKPTGFSSCKYSCDLKTLYGRRSDDPAWSIKLITDNQHVNYVEILSSYVVDNEFENNARHTIDIKINLYERLIIVCGECKFSKTLGKTALYDFPFVVNRIDCDKECVSIYPFTPIVLENIDDKLTDYKLYYTKQYIDTLNDNDVDLGEIDYDYFIKHYDFFRMLTEIGEDENI